MYLLVFLKVCLLWLNNLYGKLYIGIIIDLLFFLLVGKIKCENDVNVGNIWVLVCDKVGSYIFG